MRRVTEVIGSWPAQRTREQEHGGEAVSCRDGDVRGRDCRPEEMDCGLEGRGFQDGVVYCLK